MMKSVRGKLILFLSSAAIITALCLITLSLYIYRGNALQERAGRLVAWGTIVGDMGTNTHLELVELSERSAARILILNEKGVVTADTGAEYEGQLFEHAEVREGLATGEPRYGVHRFSPGGWVIYVSVPVMSGRNPTGLVLLAQDINDVYAELSKFGWRLTGLACLVLLFLIVLGSLFAGRATTPLVNMTKAVQLMGQGYLRQQLPVRGKDEIARLAQAFNEMSLELEKGDEELRAFVANASHELRSPVSAMKTLVEAALMEGQEEKRREYLKDINQETDRLAKLLQDLLALAKIENRSLEWEPVRVNFSFSVGAVVEKLLPLARERKIHLEKKVEPDLYVWGQTVLLERLVFNLLENALKYTNEMGRVEVALTQAGEEIQLTVADTGIGIPAPAQELVWQRFYRLDKARSRELGGVGLGLALVKQIADLHRAQISLSSKEGEGTTITVTFGKNQVTQNVDSK